jgi:hypothetical protein
MPYDLASDIDRTRGDVERRLTEYKSWVWSAATLTWLRGDYGLHRVQKSCRYRASADCWARQRSTKASSSTLVTEQRNEHVAMTRTSQSRTRPLLAAC